MLIHVINYNTYYYLLPKMHFKYLSNHICYWKIGRHTIIDWIKYFGQKVVKKKYRTGKQKNVAFPHNSENSGLYSMV